MRTSVLLPTEKIAAPAEFLRANAIAEMARAIEDAGCDACFVTDHPIPGDRWLRAGGHHTLDPFVALSFAAAATTTLRLQTNVLVLPYRNPFLTAKAAASLDALSGGRLVLGVAAGYLASEFEALGVPFEERNERTDEAIAAMKEVWSGDAVSFEGRGFRARGNTALPRPVQSPHPPIWVGGNSRRAIRRAVELGDGWLPFPTPPGIAGALGTAAIETIADLRAGLAYAREHAARVARRAPVEVCFVPFAAAFGASGIDPARLRDEAAELAELGVTWLALNVSCATRAEYLRAVAGLSRALAG